MQADDRHSCQDSDRAKLLVAWWRPVSTLQLIVGRLSTLADPEQVERILWDQQVLAEDARMNQWSPSTVGFCPFPIPRPRSVAQWRFVRLGHEALRRSAATLSALPVCSILSGSNRRLLPEHGEEVVHLSG
jgi:hypothetical protein